ncbi:protein LAZ1 [Tanacetum coccineum]
MENDDSFTVVTHKENKGKKVTNNNDANNGFKLPKPKLKVWVKKNVFKVWKAKEKPGSRVINNIFSALNDLDDLVALKEMCIEEMIMEQRPKGASTPSNKVVDLLVLAQTDQVLHTKNLEGTSYLDQSVMIASMIEFNDSRCVANIETFGDINALVFTSHGIRILSVNIMHDNGNLHDRVTKLHFEVEEIQKALDKNPADPILREEEAVYVHAFNEAKLDEERFLKSRIEVIRDELWVSESSYNDMVRVITNAEIKSAMFDIGDDRAPGPDGFSSDFFKKGWDIMGDDVCKSIRDFFGNGQILKEINHTFIALIPKVFIPLRINDYHPISCCNVIYKCISKILTNYIISGIKDVVSDNQSAFIPVDIQKAYDTVYWKFLEHILHKFGFNPVMIKWIMACVTSSSFSISLNRDIHVFFKGKRDDLLFSHEGMLIRLRFLFCNVGNTMKNEILGIMPFLEGNLSAMYLGVPLISSRLLNRDCKILVEKAKNWIELKHGKAKVAWDDICLPKIEGRLGLRSLEVGYTMYKLKGPNDWDLSHRVLCLEISLGEGYHLKNAAPNLIETKRDQIRWRDSNGLFHDFSVARAWDAFPHVACYEDKLLEDKDKLLHVGFGGGGVDPTTITHLAGMEHISPIMDDIVAYLIPMTHKRNVLSVIGKLIVAAVKALLEVNEVP